ncbi:MAG: hypothetical protein AAGF74_11840 [Pseudomonadota bacterium]
MGSRCKALWLGVALAASNMVSAQADPVPITFDPPALSPQNICVARDPEHVLIDRWSGWTGGPLPQADLGRTRTDIRRLRQLDPKTFAPTIEAIIAALRSVDPSYTETHAELDLIELLVASGDFRRLTTERLVHRFVDKSETLSPRFRNAAAKLLITGVGIEKDSSRGLALLKQSAYAGNADALLELAAMALRGEDIPDWEIEPELTITMALGALVGELNPTICERIWRIAREFHNGDLVKKDLATAEAWFRLAADLGDATAAWKVAEYHMDSEGFAKSNTQLLKYLRQASDAGLVYAQLELARILEVGALTPQDIPGAYALLRDASRTGDTTALIRFVSFLESHGEGYGDSAGDRLGALRQLARQPDAPGWIYTRLADDLIARNGRWAAADEAQALLEIAVDRNDRDALGKLATILLSSGDPDAMARAIDLLTLAVTRHGVSQPLDALQGVYMCRLPGAPFEETADYWASLEQDSGSNTLMLNAEQIAALSGGHAQFDLASLQSQALYARPTALASYLSYLERSEASAEKRAFWRAYSDNFDEVAKARAKLAIDLAATDSEKWSALELMREAASAGDNSAALELAALLLELNGDRDAVRQEVRAVLTPLAEAGTGNAITLLVTVDPAGAESRLRHFRQFEDVIEANGDPEALIFALPFVTEEKRAIYLDRIVGRMQCDFKSSVRLAEALHEIGLTDMARHWIDTAGKLSEDTPWKLVKLGDSYRDYVGNEEGARLMMASYRDALGRGSQTARFRLLGHYTDATDPNYDPEAAGDLLTAMIESVSTDVAAVALNYYRGSDDLVQAAVDARTDVAVHYARAAEAGNLVAMREHSRALRERARTGEDMRIAVSWLKRAAEGGDAAAMFELAQAYAFGIGITADATEAAAWVSEAAARGHTRAGELLTTMTLPGPEG